MILEFFNNTNIYIYVIGVYLYIYIILYIYNIIYPTLTRVRTCSREASTLQRTELKYVLPSSCSTNASLRSSKIILYFFKGVMC